MLKTGEITRDYGFEQRKASIEKNCEFKKFLSSRREEWEMRQKETEAKFLELSSLSEKLAAIPSEPKKRKRKAKTDSCPQQQDPFATHAAEIQVTFFKKVCMQ